MQSRFVTHFAFALALATTAAPSAAAQDALPPADSVIARYVASIGGPAAVERQSITSRGTFEITGAGVSGPLVSVQNAKGVAMTMSAPGLGDMSTVYDGTVGWSINPMQGPRLLEGAELTTMQEEAGFAAMLRKSPHVTKRETTGKGEMGGVPCWEVQATYASGRTSTECYSVTDGRMVGSKARMETPMGSLELVTLFSDWKTFDGLTTATTVTQMVGPQGITMKFDTVEFDHPDAAKAFEMPAAIQALLPKKAP